ncbi:MAG: glycosyltransferase [Oligoflexia bacterium]|nr:glycosyltransferase [Oligoflexia bacterium]
MTHALHVVQISRDASLLARTTHNEALARQERYVSLLEKFAPGSRMHILVCTRISEHAYLAHSNLTIESVCGSSLVRTLKLLLGIFRLHRRTPIDVVTTQTVFDEGSLTAILCAVLGIRCVGQIHFDPFSLRNALVDFGTSPLAKLRTALGRICMRLYFSIRTVGEATRRRILESKLHWRVTTIPIAVFEPEFLPRPKINPTPTLLFVGRLVPIKRIDRFLRIAKKVLEKLPQARLRVVGDGPERPNAEKLALELGIKDKTNFLGYVHHNQLPAIYQEASVYLMTSDAEGFGRTLVEAYRCGTPAVASRLPGIEDIIDDGKTGYLVDPDNEELFAQKVYELMTNQSLGSQFALQGEALVKEKFNPDQLSENWVKQIAAAARRAPDCVLMPRNQSLRRWAEISFSPYSIMRALQYNVVRGLTLKGRTLDVGGGTKNSYYHLLNIEGQIESINIDPKVAPTHFGDLNKPIALADSSYDNFISLNTFEHVQRDAFALKECIRVLKPGGSFHIVVPFLYQVHGSPCDYNRRTHFWWVETLEEYGIPRSNIQIEPLVWDRLSTGLSLAATGTLGRLARPFLLLPTAILALLFEGAGERMRISRRAISYTNAAVGYFISGRKPL